jgi:2-oxo-3-hexenedioate decarboxylase
MSDPGGVARAALAALDGAHPVAPFTDADPGFALPAAYRAAARLQALREARGERPVGRKLGFTNRTIWDEYGVHAPIWGPVYDTTVQPLGAGPVSLAGLAEPRIEPEIVLRLGAVPRPGMPPEALASCVEALAPGFELVQSIFPGWRFRAADTVAGAALHGRLLTGPFVPCTPDLARLLASFPMTLWRDGAVADRGDSANVLGGGPLAALAHLADLMAADPDAPPLGPGEIITTGTLTRALPVAPGETWAAEAAGLGLERIEVRFVP